MYKNHSLRIAVKRQGQKQVKRLLLAGANPLHGDNNHYPDCLTLAVLKNETKVIQVLLDFYTTFSNHEYACLLSIKKAIKIALREEIVPAFALLIPYLLHFIKLVQASTFSNVINNVLNKLLGIAHRKGNKELCELILEQEFIINQEHFICALHWQSSWLIEKMIDRKDETTTLKSKADRSVINAFAHIKDLDDCLGKKCFAYFATHYEFKELYKYFFSSCYKNLATPSHVLILICEQELTLRLHKKECLDVLFQAYGKLYLCEYLLRDVVNHIFKFLI